MRRPLHLDQHGRLSDPSLIDNAPLTDLLTALNRGGEEARVVGGAVRNALIGLPPGDIDIATTASPDAVMAAARAARFRVVPTGLAHGTVTVVVRGAPFEVTTLREDVETDGRHAVVRFGHDFSDDARRRDFTINGLSVDPSGYVHDTVGGLADLANGRVRFIGDPRTRIREDYLRVLRFFRFSARYAVADFDPDGLAACAAERGGLSRLSRERVRAEMLKLLEAPRSPDAVAAMMATCVLPAFLDNPLWPDRQARMVGIERIAGVPPDALRGLAALALRTPADALRLRDALRLSNDERDRLIRIAVHQGGRRGPPQPYDALAVLGLLYAAGREGALDAILLDHADSDVLVDDPAWRRAAVEARSLAIPTLHITGADVLERGLGKGPVIGAVLKDVQARWIGAGFPEEPAALHRLLDAAVAAARPRPHSAPD